MLPKIPDLVAHFDGHIAEFEVTSHRLKVSCRVSARGRVYSVTVANDAEPQLAQVEIKLWLGEKTAVNEPIIVTTTVSCDKSLSGHGIGQWLWDSAVALLPSIAAEHSRALRHEVTMWPSVDLPDSTWEKIFLPRLSRYQRTPDSLPAKWTRDFIPQPVPSGDG